ncbi:putative S-adenosylmethionine-dependent methyltransferase [Tricharina praecox]|uniref:putative S-adenosylmethionine-dependent methyltransferase n=1 Tax=Tricharina praecox TaxID=43433 RepID=UPI002220AF4F|nr:putative S-adenosylmethionine-dependent methyltransferase [Tricharina praecox]KAI5854391.1 putative S-adenosylmethionine-dependent methyltransferase [Tricharina praecox]
MATFSAATFSSARYASFRPTYPTSLYTNFLLPYHTGARTTLLDLGCGPGTVTRPLSAYFTRTIGTDPSEVMLSTARKLTPSTEYVGVEYRASAAEDLPFLADGEVDMVVAAQAAHWFNQPRWWAEMRRVVRKGGTLAAWGYRDFLFTRFPRASQVLRTYSYGENTLGPHWGQPGRSIVENRLRAVRPPAADWEDVLRWEHEPDFEGLMKRTMKMGDVEHYIRTWSACHAWKETHPEATSIADGGEGDIVDEMMRKMREVEGWGDDWREMRADIAWGHAVILARRK